MIEIKIRFKSGEIGYFTLKPKQNIHEVLDFLKDNVASSTHKVLELIDLVDDKKTYINVSEICTFGYSKVNSDKYGEI